MKTFKQFIAEADAYTKVPAGAPASGGGMSTAEIDARTDLTPAQKANLKARRARVPGQNIRGTTPPAGGAPKPPASAPAGGGGTPPRPGAMVKSPGGELVKSTAKAGAGGAAQGAGELALNAARGVKTATKIPGLKSGAALGAALGTADERSKGSGWMRSLAKGATVAAGSVLGGIAGGTAGTAIAPGAGTAIGSYAGQAAGGELASRAFDTAAGANAVQRKAIATANRQSQAGGALKGIGGKTTFDTKKGTMTTGAGSQRKTVQLGKTSVVTDPKTGKQGVGYLAYKGGQAVYKRPDTKSLAQTSSNPFERIGRTINPGAYKANDARIAAQKLAQARASDTARNKALGVKMKPGG